MPMLIRRNVRGQFAVLIVSPDGTVDDLAYGPYSTEGAAKGMKTRAERWEANRKPELRNTFKVAPIALEWESNHG